MGKLGDFRTVESVFLILAAIFLLLCIIQSPTTEEVGADVRTRRSGEQPCMRGMLHGCRDGSVWSAPQQSQTSNHHLACETVTGDGTRLQLVLDPRTEASSSVFPLDSEHRSLAPPPPTPSLQPPFPSMPGVGPTGSPLVTGVFPS